MLFHTIDFIIFFIITSILTLSLKGIPRLAVLLVSSLFFYAWGNLSYLALLIAVIIWTYVAAVIVEKHKNKFIMALIIIVSFLPLVIYKYLPFFTGQVNHMLGVSIPLVKFMLPIGISFYTFQSIGYIIDVYKNKYPPEKNIIIYANFLSFFPLILAGPIERGNNLFWQIKQDKGFNYDRVISGLKFMLVGYVLKVVIAERMAEIVNPVYSNIAGSNGLAILIATICFAIQIYSDFSGYSIIAIGTAKVIGIDLMKNFDRPYLSTSVTEFWRRWHISLSSWFKDYVYIPLGGSRCSKPRHYFNIIVTFTLSGLWHGASWTFVAWGFLNGLILVVEKITKFYKESTNKYVTFIKWLFTFLFINLTWVFFRSDNISIAFNAVRKMLTDIPGVISQLSGLQNILRFYVSSGWSKFSIIPLVISTIIYFWFEKRDMYKYLSGIKDRSIFYRWTFYFGMTLVILLFGVLRDQGGFIYFKF